MLPKMRPNLVIVMPSGTSRGGAEEALRQLLGHREAAGFGKVTVVCLEPGDLPEVLRATGVTVEEVDAGRLREPGKWLRAVRRIADIVRRDGADLVLGWMTKAHLYGGPAARLAGVPAWYFQMGLPDDGVVDRLSRTIPAAGALACSRFAAEAQAARTRVRVVGVPLAADLERFDPERLPDVAGLRERFGWPRERPVIGMVGRLQRWKGMHVFVEAIAAVRRTRPDVLGVIVGGAHDLEPDYEGFLRTRIRELGQEDAVRMVGKQTAVPEWMQAMDIVVHASDREPFGIVVVEAMALGKPVIAARPGGPEEIIDPGVDGLLTPFGEVDALAEAMRRFLDDAAFAASCGTAAREKARAFSPEAFARRVGEAVGSRELAVGSWQ